MTRDEREILPRHHLLPIYLIEIVSILIGFVLILLVFSPWPDMAFGQYAREIKTSAAGSGMLLILLSTVRIAEKIASGHEHTNLIYQLHQMSATIEALRLSIEVSVQRLREEVKGTTASRVFFDKSLKRQIAQELAL